MIGAVMRQRELAVPAEKKALVPQLLVPTPAQLARGERVIDLDPDAWCKAVRDMVKRAERAGWTCRVTYSHFLGVPPVAGRMTGQWVPTHVQCVRLRGMFAQAWGAWHGTDHDGWKWDSGQYLPLGGLLMNVSATGLSGLITGKMTIKCDERTGKRRVEEIAGRS